MTTYNKNNRVPSYALYGVPEQEAYGGVPTDEAYRSGLDNGMYQFEKDRLADEQALRDELRKNMQAIFPENGQNVLLSIDESNNGISNNVLTSSASSPSSYKLAQNTFHNEANDSAYADNISVQNNYSDDELINMMYPMVYNSENLKDYPYYDTRFNITTGVGKNLNNPNNFKRMNWNINGYPAISQDLEECLHDLKMEKEQIQKERIKKGLDPKLNNYKADHFEEICKIRLDRDTIYQMYYDHMKGDLKSLRGLIPNFDALSLNKKFVLMDYMYNLGAKKFSVENFPNFIEGARTNNLQLMLDNCSRIGVHDDRNKWTYDMLSKDLIK